MSRCQFHQLIMNSFFGTKELSGTISSTIYEQLLYTDPESAKKTDNLTVFCALLGSAHIKASQKMFMKLTIR